jgi:hypothetical protein
VELVALKNRICRNGKLVGLRYGIGLAKSRRFQLLGAPPPVLQFRIAVDDLVGVDRFFPVQLEGHVTRYRSGTTTRDNSDGFLYLDIEVARFWWGFERIFGSTVSLEVKVKANVLRVVALYVFFTGSVYEKYVRTRQKMKFRNQQLIASSIVHFMQPIIKWNVFLLVSLKFHWR